MPIPKQKSKDDFERIQKQHIDEWLVAKIEDVRYEEEHQFKGERPRVCEAVQFKLLIDGYNEPKYSRWLTFSYSENANLYKSFILPLVEGAYEYFDFDIFKLKGMRIKVMFSESEHKGEVYQNISKVKPLDGPFKFGPKKERLTEPLPEIQMNDDLERAQREAEQTDENIPF